ncbi:DNRLRE domain-containing protein [Streptosporangium sandarakinum]|uniref:DNRLRE domain-containing protein n=1 Tax=Streptosporangium sandarakinum TaxID=1260955 RepID=UPI003422B747
MNSRSLPRRGIVGISVLAALCAAAVPALPGSPAYAQPPEAAPSPLASALKSAKEHNAPVEIEAERTERSTSWALPNGLVRTELSSGPERVKRNGAWVAIDTTLEQRDGVLKPRAAKADIEISATGDGAVAKLTHGGRRSFGVRWAKRLPVPLVQGNTATYRDVVPGGDLVVTALPTGITHDVILRERPTAPLEIPMPLELSKLKFGKDKQSRLRLNDEFGNLIAAAPEPQMWDAAADASPDAGKRASVTTEVTQEHGRPTLVLKPDAAFLNDPATQYPVTIDPWTTLALKTDTFVSSDYTTGQSASTWLHAGKFGSGAKTARSYLKFDTASILGSNIVNADLRLWNYKSNTCGTAVGSGIQVRRITSYWKSADLTLANQPPTTTEDAVTLKTAAGAPDCASAELYYSIEGIVQDWADGQPGYGIQLRAANEGDATNWRMYYSSENTDTAHRPKLVVDHQPRATDATVANGVMNLRWAGVSGASEYVLYDDNEEVEIWRGTTASVDLPIAAPAYKSLIARAVTAAGTQDVAKFLITAPEADAGQAPLTVATSMTKSIIDWTDAAASDPSVEPEYRLTDATQAQTVLPEPIAAVDTSLGQEAAYQVEANPVVSDDEGEANPVVDVEPSPEPTPDETGEGNGESEPYIPRAADEPSTEPESLLLGVEISTAAAPQTLARAAASKRITQSWVTYEAYIPKAMIDAPELGGRYITCEGGADWWYKGDNRSFGFNTNKFRTRAAIKYDWDNKKNYTYRAWHATHRYKKNSNGTFSYNSQRLASASSFHIRSLKNTGKSARVVIEHDVGNPYCNPLADISYASQQDVYSNGKHWLYGTHDKMPNHEVYRNDYYSDGTHKLSRIFTHVMKKADCLVPAAPGCGKWKYQYVK